MLKLIEKLINEHGSSSILKERLGLVRDQYDALERKLVDMEQRAVTAEAELTQAQRTIRNMAGKIQTQQSNDDIPEDAQRVLKLLFRSDGSTDAIGRELNLDVGVVQYHVDELTKRGFVSMGSITMGNPLTGQDGCIELAITAEGRKFVVEVLGV